MASKTTVARAPELMAAQVVVWDLMNGTHCLDDVKGCDIPELVRGIAIGIARERDRRTETAETAENLEQDGGKNPPVHLW